jgi:pilus assembly protein CpaF
MISLKPELPRTEFSLSRQKEFQRAKVNLHRRLIEVLDLSRLPAVGEHELRAQIARMADALGRQEPGLFNQIERERLVQEVVDETFGLGPLEMLLQDDAISDILVNGHQTVYVERNGRLELTDLVFADDLHLMQVIQRVVARVGRRIDEAAPMVDARLPDGSRVNAVIPPLAIDGPTLSIRKFGRKPLIAENIVQRRSLTEDMLKFLSAVVTAQINILISGGTGTGKTTLLKILSGFIPADERIVTIEDSAELILQQPHVVRLETRDRNLEGMGLVTQRDLVRNSLRMRPDRIIVGEVRGAEVLDMLQAMNTGHDGSLTTIHANDTRDALSRLELMAGMAGLELPIPVLRYYMQSALKIIIQLSRMKGGERKVVRISELAGLSNGEYVVHDIFGFRQTSVDSEGNARGHFYTTGYVPKILDLLSVAGVQIDATVFEERQVESSPAGSSNSD